MAIDKKLRTHLKKNKVTFEIVPHKKVYTAYDLAQTLGEKLDGITKTLLLQVKFPKVTKKKPGYYVVALPANMQADFNKIKKELNALKVELAPERVMKKLGIEPGTLPPVASLHKLELLLDKSLTRTKKILMRAGSLTESVRMNVKDLHKIEKPLVGVFGKKPAKKAPKKKPAKKKIAKKKSAKKKPAKKKKK